MDKKELLNKVCGAVLQESVRCREEHLDRDVATLCIIRTAFEALIEGLPE